MHKFCDWLSNTGIAYKLHEVKGGFILDFPEADEALKKHLASCFIMHDTGEEDINTHLAISEKISLLNTPGDSFVIPYDYTANLVNSLYSAVRNYVEEK